MVVVPRTSAASHPTFFEREKLLWDVSRRYVKGEMPRAERQAYERRFGYGSWQGQPEAPECGEDGGKEEEA